MSIVIRRATPADEVTIDEWLRSLGDVEEFVNVGGVAVRDPEAVRQRYSEWLVRPREQKVPPGGERIEIVAVDDAGSMCGFCSLLIGIPDHLTGQPEATVATLHVWPEYREQGIAKGLLSMAESYASLRGMPYLSISVSSKSATALLLFKSVGFAEETVKLTKRLGADW